MINFMDFNMDLPLIGGMLIGLSASIFLLFNGRIAGISGITNRLLAFKKGDISWRVYFLIGLIFPGFLMMKSNPELFPSTLKNPLTLIIAGLLVGVGSSMGNGCTSGHGVCGISRLSMRSIVATFTFMITAILTVSILNKFGR